MVEKNPCWKVPLLPERNVRDRIVSSEELEMLQNELPKYMLILTLSYYLGMREGEILNLREKQIHFYDNGAEEGSIELYDGETKSGEGRKNPFGSLIGRLLKDYLTKQGKRDPERFLFTTESGNLLGNFRRGFQRACRRAGIKGLCFHDFRHTAITNMRKAGVNISVIMAISGHRTDAMFRRYNRIDLNDGREAMQRLERYLSETGIQANQERNEKKKDQRIEDDYCNITATRKNGEIAYA
jgi:integrase